MSRITGTDAFNMMEAYNAVYAPQELTEEQVWEEVEAWVNSLVEEGYDLSEYSWEDMYEEYISEAIGQPGSAGMINWKDKNTGAVRSGYKSSSDGKIYKNYNDALAARNSRLRSQPASSRYTINNMGAAQYAAFKGGGGLDAMERKGQTAGQVVAQGRTNIGKFDGGPRQGNPNIVGSPVVGQRRPAAQPPARPTAQPPARPVAAPGQAKPTTTATPPAAPATAPAAPARPSLRSDIADLQKMRLASQERQRKGGATVVGSQMASFDMFDVVQGYLIDEGYAETEEAAAVIMANMSEEWRQSIIEQQVVSDPGGKGGKVTVGKEYPAVYRGQKGMKFTSVTGQRYFTQDPSGYAKASPSK